MALRNGKETYNKVLKKKEHDKKKRPTTIEIDHETEKENKPSPSLVMFDSIVTYKPRVPCC